MKVPFLHEDTVKCLSPNSVKLLLFMCGNIHAGQSSGVIEHDSKRLGWSVIHAIVNRLRHLSRLHASAPLVDHCKQTVGIDNAGRRGDIRWAHRLRFTWAPRTTYCQQIIHIHIAILAWHGRNVGRQTRTDRLLLIASHVNVIADDAIRQIKIDLVVITPILIGVFRIRRRISGVTLVVAGREALQTVIGWRVFEIGVSIDIGAARSVEFHIAVRNRWRRLSAATMSIPNPGRRGLVVPCDEAMA